MKKIFIISTDTYLDLDDVSKIELLNILKEICDNKNAICFVTIDYEKRKLIETSINTDKKINGIYFKSREEIKNILDRNSDKKHLFVVIGSKEVDFTLAVNNKLLFLVPEWNHIKEEKALKYGIHIDNLSTLNEIIKSLNNQNEWFYELELPDGTKVYSIMCAHTRNFDIPADEKRLVQGFENFLKRGNGTYYKVLLSHFIAFMSNNPEFRDINCWGIMPSSGLSLNKDMYNFKEIVRYFMKGRVPKGLNNMPEINNIFLRNTKIQKSHETNTQTRMNNGATVHLESVNINPAYKKGNSNALNGKNVCIFDDYLTHGNSFEALRNMLRKAGANKIVFVSLGRFRRDYIYQEYDIEGDLFTKNGISYKLINREIMRGTYNEKARGEIRELANIFNM